MIAGGRSELGGSRCLKLEYRYACPGRKQRLTFVFKTFASIKLLFGEINGRLAWNVGTINYYRDETSGTPEYEKVHRKVVRREFTQKEQLLFMPSKIISYSSPTGIRKWIDTGSGIKFGVSKGVIMLEKEKARTFLETKSKKQIITSLYAASQSRF